MLVRDRRTFTLGSVMAITFLLVFVYMFTPSFDGRNAFESADRLFNSISKGSTYYIPELREKVRAWRGTPVQAPLELGGDKEAARVVLVTNRLEVSDSGAELELRDDLARILGAALEDANSVFHNNSEEIREKYDVPERQALYVWWKVLTGLERSLTRQENFAAAAYVSEVRARGIEVAYNFYGIAHEQAVSKAPILTFSLAFYVLYTLWWGYAIYFLAQGLGLQLRPGARKEV